MRGTQPGRGEVAEMALVCLLIYPVFSGVHSPSMWTGSKAPSRGVGDGEP